MSEEKLMAILKYMNLRVKGWGSGLTHDEIVILNGLSTSENSALDTAILELGGSLAEGAKVLPELSIEEKSFSMILKGMWVHGHEWAVEQVRHRLEGG